jgi:hypothetical protein
MKELLVFFAVFLFINLLSIYIMGGFYNQTIYSKATTEFIAFTVGLFSALIYYFLKK